LWVVIKQLFDGMLIHTYHYTRRWSY
jgi:hypothetical protein